MKTSYLPDGRIDIESYDEMMKIQIANGVEGVLVGSTAGEGHLLSWDEHIMLIGHTSNHFGRSIRVIGFTGSNSTGEAIRATEQGFAVGMDAALQINPYYGKTSIQGLVAHLEAVLPLGPTVIYDVPYRTGQDIPADIMHDLARNNPNFVGVKECAGNERAKDYVDKGLVIWSGVDNHCYEAMLTCGAVGVMSIASNLVPGLMRELVFEGENALLYEKLKPLFQWLSCEANPIPLNTGLMQLGVIHPVFRLPYYPLPLEKRKEFIEIVKAVGRDNFVGDKDVQVLNDDDFILVGRY
jgi:4-hydroxy-tetrahydrodipicolinate synthase